MATVNKAATSAPISRVNSNRENGRRGGIATAKKHGDAFCQARAEKAGLTVKARYGSGFYSHLAKLRKTNRGWPKNKQRKVIKQDPVLQNMLEIVTAKDAYRVV